MRSNRQLFTLIEMLAVIAILLLVIGLTVKVAGHIPAFVSLKANVSEVAKIFAEASRGAVVTGNEVIVSFDNEQRRFSLSHKTRAVDFEHDTSSKTLSSYTLGTGVTLLTASGDKLDEEEKIIYRFFPDSTASGPAILLGLKQHTMQLKLSPLTGILNVNEVDIEP